MQQIKRILIDNSGYELKNLGDVAMLVAAVSRLQKRFPHAEVHILTKAPDRLHKLIPSAIPVSLTDKGQWLQNWNVLGWAHKLLPSSFHPWLLYQESIAKLNYPTFTSRWIKRRFKKRKQDTTPMCNFLDEIAQADMVIATGGGYITDPFKNHAISLLQILALAQSLGKPTALFGQGLGPATSPYLLAWAKRVLPNLDYLSIRESQHSKPFALSVGASTDKIKVTGDDAIALAYSKTPPELGSAIGVNLRVAGYSGLQVEALNIIQRIMTSSATNLGAELLPIPISVHDEDSDIRSLQILLGDEAFEKASKMDTPEKVINQIGKCRVVITGSYHAGVFALSQGVSVIGVAASDYYRHKFEGLADQFRGGCQIVDRDKPEFETNLMSAIQKSWAEAEGVRPDLLTKAQEQIKSAEFAYDSFASIVEKKRRSDKKSL